VVNDHPGDPVTLHEDTERDLRHARRATRMTTAILEPTAGRAIPHTIEEQAPRRRRPAATSVALKDANTDPEFQDVANSGPPRRDRDHSGGASAVEARKAGDR
jgi:hypothetical protein